MASGFLKATSAALANGSTTVNVTGGVDCSFVSSGTAVYVDNNLLEGVSGTAADPSGNSTITIKDAWQGTTLSGVKLVAFNTIEGLRDAIQKARDLSSTFIEAEAILQGTSSEFRKFLISTEESELLTFPEGDVTVTPYLALNSKVSEVELQSAAMSKSEFFALAEKRKRDAAGSGFLEMGKQRVRSTVTSINEGLWANPVVSNLLFSGRSISEIGGISRTEFPLVLVNGVQHSVSGIGANPTFQNEILPPPAPDGTKTYDSATGVVTQHASAAEAFRGESPELGSYSANNCTNDDGVVTYIDANGGGIYYDVTVVAGQAYNISAVCAGTTLSTAALFVYDGAGFGTLLGSTALSGDAANHSLTVVPTGTTIRAYLFTAAGTAAGSVTTWTSISVLPATTSVITTRKDLVLLETWHEAIEDKDVFVPYGNVQYGANNFKGVTMHLLTAYGVAQGYSAFGEWDTTTTGSGQRWSTLQESEKKLFLADPDNNIYYDPEVGKYIQVRYRVRVIEGLGNEWENVSTQTNSLLRYSNNSITRVTTRGTLATVDDLNNSGDYLYTADSAIFTLESSGVFESRLTTGAGTARAHNGLCFAVPIALVQRLNQGAYHPVFNSEGCSTFYNTDKTGWYRKWYASDAIAITAKAQCFDLNYIHAYSGNIGNGNSGRPDQYEYYDAIYAGLVEDLRLNANKLDLEQAREDSKRKNVAGTKRGKGKVPFTTIHQSDSGSDVQNIDANTIRVWASKFNSDIRGAENYASIYIQASDGNYYGSSDLTTTASDDRFIDVRVPSHGYTAGNFTIVLASYVLTPEYDSLPWTDIIGDPVRIAATFPNGVVGQWIPVVPDGVLLYSDMRLNRKMIGTLSSAPYTQDDGATWTLGSLAISNVLNAPLSNSAFPSDRVQVVPYETLANPTVSASNGVVVGEIGNVWASAFNTVDAGNRLAPSLSGVILKDGSYGNYSREFAIRTVARETSGAINNSASRAPTHEALPLYAPLNNSPAVKALHTLTEKNGLLYDQWHWAELTFNDNVTVTKYAAGQGQITVNAGDVILFSGFDNAAVNILMHVATSRAINYTVTSFDTWTVVGGVFEDIVTANAHPTFQPYITGWGDDSVIPVVDNEDTKVDLNGTTVKVGCHIGVEPVGIA